MFPTRIHSFCGACEGMARWFLYMVGFSLDGFSRECEQSFVARFLSGKRKRPVQFFCWLIRFVINWVIYIYIYGSSRIWTVS
jgi:hypothetical protein